MGSQAAWRDLICTASFSFSWSISHLLSTPLNLAGSVLSSVPLLVHVENQVLFLPVKHRLLSFSHLCECLLKRCHVELQIFF